MYHSDSRFYLRSLPFVGAILGFLLVLYFFPDAMAAISDYLFNTDPEEDFSPNGWSLYALIVPLSIAGLSRFKVNWSFILALVLFPPILALSYWLWELLAWCMLGVWFAWMFIWRLDQNDNVSLIVLAITVILYAICRIFGSFGDGELLAIGDVVFVTILGGYMLVTSVIDTLYYDGDFKPSGISLLYILILCIALLCLSKLDNSSFAITSQKVEQATTVQKEINYCTATSGVNVRNAASSSATAVGKLKYGDAVEVLEAGSTFTKIAYNHSKGTTAWVSTKYLSPTKPAATATKKTASNNSAKTTSPTTSTKTTSSAASSKAADRRYEYVDLGLSVKWATCNVGARKPEDYGDFFAWGETKPKRDYYESNYSYTANPSTLPMSADAARVNWGGSWRMPTKAELNDLRTKCTWTWTTQNGVDGFLVKRNGNSIFLPAAGYYWNKDHLNVRACCIYWSSSIHPDDPNEANYLNYTKHNQNWVLGDDRFKGKPIRPVCP